MDKRTTLSAFCILFSTALLAQSTPVRGADSPQHAEDGTWVGISGTVESTSKGSFVLDYGEGSILVNVDPVAKEPHEFQANEAVTVYGVLDKGFFMKTTIQARTVFLNSQKIYTCSTDGANERVMSFVPSVYTGSLVHGRVHKVSGAKLTIDEGENMLTVDTSALKDQLNAEGESTVQEGDVVTVMGVMDKGFFTGRTLKASSMDVLHF